MTSKYSPLDAEKPEREHLRIVLIGKTGAGKSATGNTILGRKAFTSKPSFSSVAAECQKETGEFNNQPLDVIDTPGLFDTDKTEAQVIEQLSRCISFAAPGPHVFLVVMQPNRYTEEEETVKIIKKVFGEKAADYIIVLFTHGDDLEADRVSMKELIEENENVKAFIGECGGRYHLFNNREKDSSQVEKVLEKISDLVQRNGASCYTNDMFQEANRAIEEEMQALLRENPNKVSDEARRRAKRNNLFIQALLEYAATGAAIGARAGRWMGPVGSFGTAAVGGSLGLIFGSLVILVRALRALFM